MLAFVATAPGFIASSAASWPAVDAPPPCVRAVSRISRPILLAAPAFLTREDGKNGKLRKLLDSKVKLFQTYCDVVRPDDGVQLLEQPEGGWRAIPVATLISYIEMVGDGEVPKGGYLVDGNWDGTTAHTPKVRLGRWRGWGECCRDIPPVCFCPRSLTSRTASTSQAGWCRTRWGTCTEPCTR